MNVRQSTPGPETPDTPEVISPREKLNKLNNNIRESQNIALEDVKQSPLKPTDITKAFYETHDMNSEDNQKKLAEYMLTVEVV